MKKLFFWLVYPVVMVSAFMLFVQLQSQGFSLQTGTYISIVTMAMLISLLELKFPYSAQWRPSVGDVRVDLIFMAVVQLALPPLIGFTFTYTLLEPARSLDLPFVQLWPHSWPIWMQVLLMVLLADFLRYWLHRAAHTNKYLWRLHSVHHSVEKLYWLNTGRFHPLEKILQVLMDSLPFLLMGVDEKILGLYYIAYATNGFLQHSNIQFRFGLLNYVIGSADLHRWHHSKEPSESNTNYGNNVIIWDLLFGTWFLPKERNVEALGLQEEAYPKTFLGQLRAPFRQ
ncbi:MAG: sterol desaturase family protein [Methylotenera sp.]